MRVWHRRRGASGAEYALLLGLLAMAVVGAIATLGGRVGDLFVAAENSIAPGSDSGAAEPETPPVQAGMLTVAPTELDLSDDTACHAVTVTNTGTAAVPLQVDATALDTARFARCQPAGTACGASLDASQACVFGLMQRPAMPGTFSSSVVVRGTPAGAPAQAIPVFVTAIVDALAEAPLAVTPRRLSFTAPGTCRFVTVTNTTASAVPLQIDPATDFDAVTYPACDSGAGAGTPCAATLAAGASCTHGVELAAEVSDPQPDLLRFASGSQQVDVEVSATAGVAPVGLTVTPADSSVVLDWQGQWQVEGAPIAVTVRNVSGTATAPLQLVLSDAQRLDLGDEDCAGLALQPEAECTVNLIPRAWDNGIDTATLLIFGSGAAYGQAAVTVEGRGFAAGLVVTPTSVMPDEGGCAAVRVSNSYYASQPLAIASPDARFPLCDPGSGTACGSSLAAQASCSFGIGFQPGSDSGLISATVNVSTPNDSAPAQRTPVTARGYKPAPPALEASPTYLMLKPEDGCQPIEISNTGAPTLSIPVTAPFPANQAQQCAVPNDCGPTLAGGESCNIGFELTPSFSGNFSTPIRVGGLSGSVEPTVVGMEIDPEISITPQQLVLSDSSCQSVTIRNDAPGGYAEIVVENDPSAGFAICENTCGYLLGAYQDCRIGVRNDGAVSGDSGTLEIGVRYGNGYTATVDILAEGEPDFAWFDGDGNPISSATAPGRVYLTNIGTAAGFVRVIDDSSQWQFWPVGTPRPTDDSDAECTEAIAPGAACVLDFVHLYGEGTGGLMPSWDGPDGQVDGPYLSMEQP